MTIVPARILLLEDHEDSLTLLQLLLQKSGYEVVCAKLCEQALALAQEAPLPDLYILDHCLIDGTGTELRAKLRGLSPRTPALFYTGVHYPDCEVELLRRAGDDYLMKPVDIVTLRKAIALLLARPIT